MAPFQIESCPALNGEAVAGVGGIPESLVSKKKVSPLGALDKFENICKLSQTISPCHYHGSHGCGMPVTSLKRYRWWRGFMKAKSFICNSHWVIQLGLSPRDTNWPA